MPGVYTEYNDGFTSILSRVIKVERSIFRAFTLRICRRWEIRPSSPFFALSHGQFHYHSLLNDLGLTAIIFLNYMTKTKFNLTNGLY
jgi:hypothetical protein